MGAKRSIDLILSIFTTNPLSSGKDTLWIKISQKLSDIFGKKSATDTEFTYFVSVDLKSYAPVFTNFKKVIPYLEGATFAVLFRYLLWHLIYYY